MVSFSLSCLEQVKEWLERDQKGPEAPIKGAPTDARHPGKSGGGDRVKDSNNLCSLNISFSFVSLRIYSTSDQKSIKLQSHGAQIRKGSSTCPKLLSYHAITSTTTHQLFHLTDTFTCSSSNFICCKCSKMYVGQAYKTIRDCFCHHRAAAKVKKRSWPLPLYMSRLQRWRILN